MFNALRIRVNQGYQTIRDITKPKLPLTYPGFPVIARADCRDCSICRDVCPSNAISSEPLAVDMGKCVFCRDCERVCPSNNLKFSSFHKTASTSRERLIVTSEINEADYYKLAAMASAELKTIFGRSLKLRQISAGGCNGCELELNACGNVNFDMGRFGVEFVASARHADGIVLTGPISTNMAASLEDAYQSIPAPKLIILTGACAISGGVFADSPAIDRQFLDKYPIDLYVPGCPVHPLTFINGILKLLGRVV